VSPAVVRTCLACANRREVGEEDDALFTQYGGGYCSQASGCDTEKSQHWRPRSGEQSPTETGEEIDRLRRQLAEARAERDAAIELVGRVVTANLREERESRASPEPLTEASMQGRIRQLLDESQRGWALAEKFRAAVKALVADWDATDHNHVLDEYGMGCRASYSTDGRRTSCTCGLAESEAIVERARALLKKVGP
jgi:hypothetical protein